MNYQVELSHRATRDLDRLGRDVQSRIMKRLEQLAENPYEGRLSGPLANQGGLRKSRVPIGGSFTWWTTRRGCFMW